MVLQGLLKVATREPSSQLQGLKRRERRKKEREREEERDGGRERRDREREEGGRG